MRIVYFILFLLVGILPAQAQLLIDIGYSPSFYDIDAMQSIKESFNAERSWLDKELKSFRTLHGVHARIKHRFVNWGPWLELNYQINSNAYSGTQIGNTEPTKGKIKSSYVSMLGGLEWEQRTFGLGAGVGQQTLRYQAKEQTGVSKIDENIFDESNFVFTVYINIIPAYESRNITNLVLQPYVVYPFAKADFSPINDYYSASVQPLQDNIWLVGLRLVLSNGQR